MSAEHITKKVAKPVRKPYRRMDKALGQVPVVLQVSAPQPPAPRLMTPIQLAHLLQVNPMTVRRHMKDGMPHMRVGNRIRFDPNDVISYLKKKQEK